MIKEAIATGETVEAAKEAACRELGVESYEAEFEVLELPVKKTFGLFGGSPAKVRAFVKTSPAQVAADYLRDILEHMGVADVGFSISEEENGAVITITGDDIGFVIGHRGETLDALQYLSGLVSNHVENSYYRITLDIGNYREKRRDTLETLGKKMAAKAVRTGRNVSLEPMNPYERRIIHTAVQEVEGAKSWSEGEDTGRHVVIGPVEGERPQRRGYRDGNRYGNRDRYDRSGRGGYRQDRERRDYAFRRDYGEGRSYQKAEATSNSAAVAPTAPRQEIKGALYGRIDVVKKNTEEAGE